MRPSGTDFCLGSGAAFGAMAVFGKLASGEGATVGTLLAFRFVLAAAVFWGLVLAGGGAREVRALRRRDVGVGLALGGCGYASQAACYFAALKRIDAGQLSILLYTFPVVVAAAAVALGREQVNARQLAALALTSSGLVLIVAGTGAHALDPLGVALGLGAARRAACRGADRSRLGLAGLPRRRLDRRLDQPLLRRPAPSRGDHRLVLATVEPVVSGPKSDSETVCRH